MSKEQKVIQLNEDKTVVFKIGFDGGSCFVFDQSDIMPIIQHEIIENETLDVGDVLDISITVTELTDEEIEAAGEFDGF